MTDTSDKADPLEWEKRNAAMAGCGSEHYNCKTGIVVCILISNVCNSQNDCSDHSDESDCFVYPEKPPNRECRRDQFTCGDGDCISERYVCDGIKDCRWGEDEQNCRPDNICDGVECPSGKCIGNGYQQPALKPRFHNH